MTIWVAVGVCLGMAAYAVAWIWGGRTERFAAAVMLLHFAVAAMSIIYGWEGAGLYLPRTIADYVRLLIFGWLCLRSDRWWPLLMTAALVLMVVAEVVGLNNPEIAQWGVVSAQIGFGYIVDLTLLLSVCERWLAGEPSARHAAWVRAAAATATRRREKALRRPDADLARLWRARTRGPRPRIPRLPA
ncbi:hypothetical protein [Brevundimonas sp.]|uniref:hypothetical protein n=1 Tax=Brevundimonas sp. TaxID=1871086 RepID=UPI002FC96AE2